MDTPLISVIMPVYNREKYVEEAIKSILNQTVTDLELIVVDDASTDNTLNVIYSINDQRIQVFQLKENKGVSAAYNTGLSKARGLFIARMDSDDISIPDRLEKQLSFLERNPHISICGSWVKFMNSEKLIKHKETHNEIITEMLIQCPLSMGAVMYKKSDLNNFILDENLRFGEDYDLWCRVCWELKMYNIQEPLLIYRTHLEQLSGLNKNEQINLDVEMKLSLFKKLKYPLSKFPDEILIKFMGFYKPITISELSIYLKWLKFISEANKSQKVFPQNELDVTLKKIKNDLLFKIFFTNQIKGIDKVWRINSLKHLELNDSLNILIKKLKLKLNTRKA